MSWRTRKLSHLDLSYNDIADVSALATVLVKNWPATLKTLIISHNAIVELPASIGRLNALEVKKSSLQFNVCVCVCSILRLFLLLFGRLRRTDKPDILLK